MRKNLSMEAIMGRVRKMVNMRNEYMKDIENAHVKLQQGNSKTGRNCWTVSLIPIADCKNCSECKGTCYDVCNVCYIPAVQNDRARNSAVHKADLTRFWDEVKLGIIYNSVTELRINVGGDLNYEDFYEIKRIASDCKKCEFLFFTKSYDDINRFLDETEFPENVHPMMSAWIGMEMENPHNLPCSHVLWEDGTTTAPEFGAYYCGGNCSECHYTETGCWALKKGEHVIFKAH